MVVRGWAGLALLAAVPALTGTTPPGDAFETRLLQAHNRERASFAVSPLRWNPALADDARRWANHLAATGEFRHATQDGAEPEGENLWAGTRGHYPVEAMVDGWVREKRFFRPGAFPANSTTGRWQDVGHYTQLMWRDTHEVGCALASGAREDVLVCRYSSAGNYVGETPF